MGLIVIGSRLGDVHVPKSLRGPPYVTTNRVDQGTHRVVPRATCETA